MIDIKFLRENPDIVKENIKKKFQDRKLELVDRVIELDVESRRAQTEANELRADRNRLSKEIGALMKQGKKDEAEATKAKVNAAAERLAELEAKETELAASIREIMLTIPNIIDDSVPVGRDDSENVEIERFGEPVVPDFEIPYHTDIMERLSGIDLDSARRVAGNGFYYLMGDIARLHSSILTYARDFMIERGFTYFDTAWMYCDYKSENAVKAAVVDRHPRDSFTLTTKLHNMYVHSFEDRDKIFNEQLRKTGVEYFDYYLLHDVNVHSYETYKKYDCYEWLKEKKAKGLTRHIAMSFHDSADFLDKVLTEWPEIEFVQLQLNYLDWDSLGVQSRLCYETAVKHGKKVVVMEPVKGGTLAKLPERVETMFHEHSPAASNASWAIRFAASCPEVFMVLSGMSDMQQVLDSYTVKSGDTLSRIAICSRCSTTPRTCRTSSRSTTRSEQLSSPPSTL